MWALIVDGSINRFFKVPTAFKHPTTGNQYPRNWITLASNSEKVAVGLIEVTYSGSNGDSEYYINSESSPVYNASAGTVVNPVASANSGWVPVVPALLCIKRFLIYLLFYRMKHTIQLNS